MKHSTHALGLWLVFCATICLIGSFMPTVCGDEEESVESSTISDIFETINPPQEWRQGDPADTFVSFSSDEAELTRKRRRMERKRRIRPQDEAWSDDLEVGDQQLPSRSYFSDENQEAQRRRLSENAHRTDRLRNRLSVLEREKQELGQWEKPKRPARLGISADKTSPPAQSLQIEIKYDSPLKVQESNRPLASPSHQPPNDKSYRKPYSMRKMEDTEGSSAAKLKEILKQSGGLSLSEILQQRNLSLADLLKGKQTALAALTEAPKDFSPYSSPTTYPVTEASSEFESDREEKAIRIKAYNRPKPKIRIQQEVVEEPSSPEPPPPPPPPFSRRVPAYIPPRGAEVAATNANVATSNELAGEDEYYEDSEEEEDDTMSTFPTIFLKPILPYSREKPAPEKVRPVKEVVPKIRPDLSNSKTKTKEVFETSKLRRQSLKPTRRPDSTLAPSSSTYTPRERWSPPPRNRTMPRLQIGRGKIESPHPIAENPTESKPESVDDVPPTTPIKIATSTPRNSEVIRNRLSLKPRLRLPSRRVKIQTTTRATPTKPVVSETTPSEETSRPDEPDVNVIEKFTSFEDTKPKNVAALDQIFSPNFEYKGANDGGAMTSDKRHDSNAIHAQLDPFDEYLVHVTEPHPPTAADLTGPSVDDDRNEIMQLLEDRRSGSKLLKVLQARNMTLDELLDHRQRGSVHVQLLDALNRTKNLGDKIDIVTAFENFPRFELSDLRSVRPDDIKMDSQGFSYFTSIINLRPTDEIFKEAKVYHELYRQQKANNGPWQTDPSTSENSTTPSASSVSSYEVEQIENEVSRAHDSTLELDQDSRRPTVTIESAESLNGVRSAIVASACIVLICLLVFIVIFFVCRWRQKRRNKLNYTESYKLAQSQLPTAITTSTPASNASAAATEHFNPMLCAKHRHSLRVNSIDPNSSDLSNYLSWTNAKRGYP